MGSPRLKTKSRLLKTVEKNIPNSCIHLSFMRKTDQDIEKKLRWNAARYCLPTSFSFYWKDLPTGRQSDVASQIDVTTSGEPVLIFTTATGKWTLICTRQVIGFDGQRLERMYLTEMRQMMPHGIPPLGDQPNATRLTINKAEWNRLMITGSGDTSLTLYAQAGPDFFALWNILQMVRRLLNG